MSADDSSDIEKAPAATLTSERLRDMVLDHLLDNVNVYIAEDQSPSERFLKMMDCMNELVAKVATQAMVNRTHLSPLPTYSGSIGVNPDDDADQNAHYELRYRLVEQIGTNKPHNDTVMTLEQAQETYGDTFIANHWGTLGENCPCKITTPGDRNLWFSVVRYPIASADQSDTATQRSRPGLR